MQPTVVAAPMTTVTPAGWVLNLVGVSLQWMNQQLLVKEALPVSDSQLLLLVAEEIVEAMKDFAKDLIHSCSTVKPPAERNAATLQCSAMGKDSEVGMERVVEAKVVAAVC